MKDDQETYNITVNLNLHDHSGGEKINELLKLMLDNNKILHTMANSITDLTKQVDELQVALDAEQQQLADLLAQNATNAAALEQQIADLQAMIADGGTAEQRQALSDKLTAILTDLQGTVPE